MIITLVCIGLIILGVSLLKITEYGEFDLAGISSVFIGGIGVSVCVLFIIVAHIGVDITIRQNDIEYQSLLERRAVIDSEYEDYSKSDVLRDIADWNKDVAAARYWGKNTWTNWFYSSKVVDNLKEVE